MSLYASLDEMLSLRYLKQSWKIKARAVKIGLRTIVCINNNC